MFVRSMTRRYRREWRPVHDACRVAVGGCGWYAMGFRRGAPRPSARMCREGRVRVGAAGDGAFGERGRDENVAVRVTNLAFRLRPCLVKQPGLESLCLGRNTFLLPLPSMCGYLPPRTNTNTWEAIWLGCRSSPCSRQGFGWFITHEPTKR